MAVALLGRLGAGCVQGDAPGECMYGNMSISCGLIRECDGQTGNTHWEYALPEASGNVNINVSNAAGEIVGYANETGQIVALTRPNAASQGVVSQVQIAEFSRQAQQEAAVQYPNNPIQQAVYTAMRIQRLASDAVAAQIRTQPSTTPNTTATNQPQTTLPTQIPAVIQNTFNSAKQSVSDYVADSENWPILGAGVGVAVLLFMFSGKR